MTEMLVTLDLSHYVALIITSIMIGSSFSFIIVFASSRCLNSITGSNLVTFHCSNVEKSHLKIKVYACILVISDN